MKKQLGAKAALYPMPATLVGANVQGKPNYLAVAWCGIMSDNPPVISISLEKAHYTTPAIEENGTFSVNIPSASMVRAVDYCGIFTGHKVDKSGIFHTFYGQLGTAPLIEECPLNLECKVRQTIDFATDKAFIGEIVQAYADEECLTDGLPDLGKIEPIVYSMYTNIYWQIGGSLGRAFQVGKDYR